MIIPKYSTSLLSLITFNLIPLFGVLHYNWSIASLLLLYWCENIVIGFFNVIKMRRVSKHLVSVGSAMAMSKDPKTGEFTVPNPTVDKFLIGFFVLHFGLFTLLHGLVLHFLFINGQSFDSFGVLIGIGGLLISHFISYKTNFIDKGEYIKRTVQLGKELMFQPYKRIFITHLVIIFGGALVSATDSGVGAVVVLVILKITFDAIAHLREHHDVGRAV